MKATRPKPKARKTNKRVVKRPTQAEKLGKALYTEERDRRIAAEEELRTTRDALAKARAEAKPKVEQAQNALVEQARLAAERGQLVRVHASAMAELSTLHVPPIPPAGYDPSGYTDHLSRMQIQLGERSLSLTDVGRALEQSSAQLAAHADDLGRALEGWE